MVQQQGREARQCSSTLDMLTFKLSTIAVNYKETGVIKAIHIVAKNLEMFPFCINISNLFHNRILSIVNVIPKTNISSISENSWSIWK